MKLATWKFADYEYVLSSNGKSFLSEPLHFSIEIQRILEPFQSPKASEKSKRNKHADKGETASLKSLLLCNIQFPSLQLAGVLCIIWSMFLITWLLSLLITVPVPNVCIFVSIDSTVIGTLEVKDIRCCTIVLPSKKQFCEDLSDYHIKSPLYQDAITSSILFVKSWVRSWLRADYCIEIRGNVQWKCKFLSLTAREFTAKEMMPLPHIVNTCIYSLIICYNLVLFSTTSTDRTEMEDIIGTLREDLLTYCTISHKNKENSCSVSYRTIKQLNIDMETQEIPTAFYLYAKDTIDDVVIWARGNAASVHKRKSAMALQFVGKWSIACIRFQYSDLKMLIKKFSLLVSAEWNQSVPFTFDKYELQLAFTEVIVVRSEKQQIYPIGTVSIDNFHLSSPTQYQVFFDHSLLLRVNLQGYCLRPIVCLTHVQITIVKNNTSKFQTDSTWSLAMRIATLSIHMPSLYRILPSEKDLILLQYYYHHLQALKLKK